MLKSGIILLNHEKQQASFYEVNFFPKQYPIHFHIYDIVSTSLCLSFASAV